MQLKLFCVASSKSTQELVIAIIGYFPSMVNIFNMSFFFGIIPKFVQVS